MASALLNSEDTTDLLIICKHFIGKFNHDQDYKTYLVKSGDFIKLWNKFLLKHFINKEVKGVPLDGFSSSASSEQSVPVKEFELLKSIPQNMRQSNFFKELNKKMETYINENERNDTLKECNIDHHIVNYFNKACVDNCILPLVTTSYSNETLVKLHCNKESVSKSENLNMSYSPNREYSTSDGIQQDCKLDARRSNSNGKNSSSSNRQFFLNNVREHLDNITSFPKKTSFLSEISKKDNQFLQKKWVGCNMENATLFETTDSKIDNIELERHLAEQTEIYETLPEDRFQQRFTKVKIVKKQINEEELFARQTIFAGHGQIQINKSKYEEFRQTLENSDNSKITSNESISNLRKSKSISCTLNNNERTSVYSPSLISLPVRKIKSMACNEQSAENVIVNNTLNLKQRLKSSPLMRMPEIGNGGINFVTNKTGAKKFKGRNRYTKGVAPVLTKNELLTVDTESVKDDLSSNYFRFDPMRNESFSRDEIKQWCFTQKEGLCYVPSETSFPSYDGNEEQDFGEPNFELRTEKVQQLAMKHESSYSKVQLENELQLKLICGNNDIDLKSLDSICVSVPLDLQKYDWNCDKSTLGPFKVIKGIPVFPVDKEFRSFSHFGKMYQLKEDIFEDFTKTDLEDQAGKKVNKEESQENYIEPNLSFPQTNEKDGLDFISEMRNILENFNEDNKRIRQEGRASFVSCVSGNEIIFESVVDIERNGNDLFQRELSAKNSPGKLHQVLLNNIDKLVSIKVKHTNPELLKVQTGKNNSCKKAEVITPINSGFEVMLKFAVESMEQEYKKKNKLVPANVTIKKPYNGRHEKNLNPVMKRADSPTVNEETKLSINKHSTSVFFSSITNSSSKCGLTRKDHATATSNISAYSPIERDENLMKVVCADSQVPAEEKVRMKNLSEAESSLVNKTNKDEVNCSGKENDNNITVNEKVIWKDDSESIRIYADPEKQFSVKNKVKFSADGRDKGKIRSMQRVYVGESHSGQKNINYCGTEEQSVLPNIKKIKKPNMRVHRISSRFNIKANANMYPKCCNNTSNLKVKMLGSKFIIFKSTDTNNSYDVPKKNTFWGTMLKQTARLVPFFTFHGTKINLETLGETLSR